MRRALHRVTLGATTSAPTSLPFLQQPSCSVTVANNPGIQGVGIYGMVRYDTGVNKELKNTEFYDGYTDDLGSFKEGPPVTIRTEYLRTNELMHHDWFLYRYLWSPFDQGLAMGTYTPLYHDHRGFSSRDSMGRRSGPMLGEKRLLGHYRKKEWRMHESRVTINSHSQFRVPRWLACIVNYPRFGPPLVGLVGFFLYANGAYVAELLTYKQLPRLVYNKPLQGCLPTIGQTVELSEVTYGKDIHSVEFYPGYGAMACRAPGTSAVILRGTEPNLVPLLLPSREVRLFDKTAHAVFGRRAGVMNKFQRIFGRPSKKMLYPSRPAMRYGATNRDFHPGSGGSGFRRRPYWLQNWAWIHYNKVKTKYWLSGYILRGRKYHKKDEVSLADIKNRTYSWASRDKVYRL